MRKLRKCWFFLYREPSKQKLKINLLALSMVFVAINVQAKNVLEPKSDAGNAENIFQERTITGTVVDESGNPLPGATVIVDGTTIGATTSFEGTYSIVAPSSATTLSVSYLGFETKTISIAGKSVIDVQLAVSENALEEVVVTALGIERSKKSLAYSVTEVDGDDFTEARETNVANALTGKVAGVSVSNLASGPGGSTRVIIRGNTSLTGNNQPLYVVDGVPMDNSNQGSAGMWGGSDRGDGIGNINPDDIDKMTVLKGNTAAALYGARASNGVILITTKRGELNKGLQVEFNSNYVFEKAINYVDKQDQYGLGDRGNKPGNVDEARSFGQQSWGARLDGSSVVQFDGVSRPYSFVGDNFKNFYETGHTFTNTIAFSGGNDKLGYRFSLADLGNEGVIPNTEFQRNNITFNVHGTVADKLSIQASGQYIIQKNNITSIADSPGNPNYPIPNLPTTINVLDLYGDPNKPGADPVTGQEYLASSSVWFQNPYWAAYQYENKRERNRFIGSLNLTYDITDWLFIQGRAGVDQYDNFDQTVTPYGTSYSVNGSIGQGQKTSRETNFDVMLGSAKEFDNGIGYNVLVGANKMRQEVKSTSAGGNTYALPFFNSYSNTLNKSGGVGFSQLGTHSAYAQAEVSYKNYLFLTGTARTDWFSTLNGKNITYPSVSASAVLSDMITMPSFISYMKLRGAWAQVGGATGAYQLNQTYSLNESHQGQAVGGIAQGSVLNSELNPLTVTEKEFGIDASFFRNRLSLDFSVYDRRTEDDILNASISQTSGYTGAVVNVGEVSNKGVEVLLSGSPVRTDDFEWRTSFNLGYNKSEIVSLLDPEIDDERLEVSRSRMLIAWVHHVEGMPYGQLTGFNYLRDASGNIVNDEFGLPMQDPDVTTYGTGVHPYTWGFSNSFRYKDFSLSFLIDGKSGGKIAVGTDQQLYFRGLHKNTLIGRENGIGSVTSANLQDYYNHIGNNITEEFIHDASFIKFRELTVGFNIPSDIVKQVGASSASISFVGRNLWILSKKVDNIDPESTYEVGNGQGLEFLSEPKTRTFGFNLNVKF